MKYNENFAEKFVKQMMGKKQAEVKKTEIPKIQEMLNNLIEISDERWGLYAFRRDPLVGKFSKERKLELIEKANSCGKEFADKVKEEYGTSDIHECAKKMDIKIDYPERPLGGGHIIFAQFVEPNNVTIFNDSLSKAVRLVEEEKLCDIFGDISIENILLAHEIFHFIEENNKDIYTRIEKIRLWKLGPLKNDSNIIALGEIAGMAFAKSFLNLKFSPYVLDVFLVYLYNKEAAYLLYKEIMKIN